MQFFNHRGHREGTELHRGSLSFIMHNISEETQIQINNFTAFPKALEYYYTFNPGPCEINYLKICRVLNRQFNFCKCIFSIET